MSYEHYIHHAGYAEAFDLSMPCASHHDFINEHLDRGLVNHHMEINGNTLRTLCKAFDWAGKGPMRSNNEIPNCWSCRSVLRYSRPNRCECWEGEIFVWNLYCLYHRNKPYGFYTSTASIFPRLPLTWTVDAVVGDEIIGTVRRVPSEIEQWQRDDDNRIMDMLHYNQQFQQQPPPSDREQRLQEQLDRYRNQYNEQLATTIGLREEISTLKKYIKDKGLLLPGEVAEEPEDSAAARFKLLEIDK